MNKEELKENEEFSAKLGQVALSLICGCSFSLWFMCYYSDVVTVSNDVNSFILSLALVGVLFISTLLSYFILSVLSFFADMIGFYLKFKDVDLKELIEDYKKEEK